MRISTYSGDPGVSFVKPKGYLISDPKTVCCEEDSLPMGGITSLFACHRKRMFVGKGFISIDVWSSSNNRSSQFMANSNTPSHFMTGR